MKIHPAAELFPIVTGDEFDRLVADIRDRGQEIPIVLTKAGEILDGRNRMRACEALKVTPKTCTYEGDDPVGYVISLNLHRRHLNESQRAMAAAKLANMRQGERTDAEPSANLHKVSQADAAGKLNVAVRSVASAVRVAAKAPPDVVAAVEGGLISVSDAASIAESPPDAQTAALNAVVSGNAKTLKAAARQHDIAAQREGIESGAIVLPAGLFEVISIDPPWPYDDGGEQSPYDPAGHRASNPYPEMPLEDIAALNIPAADDCVLWLWTTHKFMRHAFPILDGWGFQERAIVTWVKDRMGLGRWLRSQSEFCIMATRGKPAISLTNQTTILHGPLREHSRKPDEFYAMVESLCVGRRLDYFSRESRKGWEQMGNDVEKFANAVG